MELEIGKGNWNYKLDFEMGGNLNLNQKIEIMSEEKNKTHSATDS